MTVVGEIVSIFAWKSLCVCSEKRCAKLEFETERLNPKLKIDLLDDYPKQTDSLHQIGLHSLNELSLKVLGRFAGLRNFDQNHPDVQQCDQVPGSDRVLKFEV